MVAQLFMSPVERLHSRVAGHKKTPGGVGRTHAEGGGKNPTRMDADNGERENESEGEWSNKLYERKRLFCVRCTLQYKTKKRWAERVSR